MKVRIKLLFILLVIFLFIAMFLKINSALGIQAKADIQPISVQDDPQYDPNYLAYESKLVSQTPAKTLLGKFTVTAYEPSKRSCGKWSNPKNPTTADGSRAIQGITVGADWNTLPEGTKIEIEGVGIRVVQDKPANSIIKRYDGKIIDVYFDSLQDAIDFGKKQLNVYIVND